MNQSIWVVERGQYSDYRVVGVFSSKENAQRIADVVNQTIDQESSEYATVEEWTLDPAIQELNQGLNKYLVIMKGNGDVVGIHNSRLDYEGIEDGFYFQSYFGEDRMMRASVWAKDEQHAVKIANEHRTRLIASGEWE